MEHNGIYNNKYRIPSTRLQNWDYGWNAIYFVTICTKDRNHYFGEMKNGEMQLLPIGAIADVLWHELNNHFDNVQLDAFVVMPNHIHAIIIIDTSRNKDNREELSLLSLVVRQYKSRITAYANKHGIEFGWQTRYHDHIIRGIHDGNKIAEYIANNVIKWNTDCFFK